MPSRRLAGTVKVEKEERAKRWEEKKLLDPPRTQPSRRRRGSVVLGQPKSEVRKLLASCPSRGWRRWRTAASTCLFFQQSRGRRHLLPRQMFVRFDKNDNVAEIRICYQDGLVLPTKDRPALLDLLKRTNGAPEKLTPTWPGIWTDIPGAHATNLLPLARRSHAGSSSATPSRPK